MPSESVLARLAIEISANAAKFTSSINTVNKNLNGLRAGVASANKSIAGFEKRISGIQRSLGSLGVAFGAFQIAGIIKSAVDSISEFESTLSAVRAITGATGSEFDSLRKDALRLGAATQFTASEVAALQVEYGRLGFTTNEILSATEATIQLAIATGEDLAKSADVAGSTVRAFGITADETQRVVDVMAKSFNSSALALDNFQNSMKFVAPIAAAANISVEETTALLGTLADAGIRGSQAGTGLRRIITELAKDGRPLSERLKELADRGLTFSGAMDEVGRFAQSALLVLARNTEKTNDLTLALDNASGSAKQAADIMQDNLAGSIKRLESAYDGLIQQQGPLADGLREVIDAATNIISYLNDASGSFAKFAKFITTYTPNLVTVARLINDIFNPERKNNLPVNEVERQIADLERQLTQALRNSESTSFIRKIIVQISELKEAYGDALEEQKKLREGAFVGPLISDEDFGLLEILGNNLQETSGILADLRQKAKEFQEAMEQATSISEIRRLQNELEKVNGRIQAILKPGVKPEPIVIPIEFGDLTANIEQLKESLRNLDIDEIGLDNKDGFVIPVNVDLPDENIEELEGKLSEIKDRLESFKESVAAIIKEGLQNVLIGFAQDLGNAVSGVGNFGDNILKALAGFAEQFGALLIAAGLAKIKFDELAFSGIGAVIAGTALIAAAQAVRSTLKSSSTALSGGSGGQSAAASSVGQTGRGRAEDLVSTIEIVGTSKISANDILIEWGRANDRNSFTRPGG